MQLIYITNDPDRARLVDDAGVDQVMVDLEINGKAERQRGLNTVISRHSAADISVLRNVLQRASVLVRINPIYDGSAHEIHEALARGADSLMLPMFTSFDEVARFIDLVAGRAGTMLLLETPAAVARLPDILSVTGIDCVHVGLNDLHLGFKLGFMFELLSGGIVSYVANHVLSRGIRFGFGGVARLDEGILPARLILSEHLRLGSQQVILSRDFSRIFEEATTQHAAADKFAAEVRKLRSYLDDVAQALPEELVRNQQLLCDTVNAIAKDLTSRSRS